jgi:hypothetical protein
MAESVPALRSMLVDRWGHRVLLHENVGGLLSIALVHRAWRNTELEDWHAANDPGSPDDYDMFRANVILTRAVRPGVVAVPLDIETLRATLTNPRRPALPSRSAESFCGPVWPDVCASAHAVVDALQTMIGAIGEDSTRIVNAAQSLMMGSSWWGTPDFASRLTRALQMHRPGRSRASVERLVAHPEEMSETDFYGVVALM